MMRHANWAHHGAFRRCAIAFAFVAWLPLSATSAAAQATSPETPPAVTFDTETAARSDGGATANSPQTREELLNSLYDQLSATEDPSNAEALQRAIERLWMTSDSATIDLLMSRAAALQQAGDNATSLKVLDSIVALKPEFVEGWNRRAFAHFTNGDFASALADLRQTLARDDRHFRAINGLATILQQLGENETALRAYRKVLEINPHLESARTAADELEREVEGQGI